ncbi:MAG: hypothetical protein SWK76_12665 [Actinomycetota bacterium]|nr:hypothetical protein [Actinomycetota bacterium]
MALLLFIILIGTGCGQQVQTRTAAETEQEPVFFEASLSTDQNQVVEDIGYPDHFFISIDPYGTDRMERWIYFSDGKALDFDNGRLDGEEEVADESAEYPPTDLRPQDFSTLMTSEEANQLLGEPLYTHEVEDSLMPENSIIIYEKAVLLYRDGQLIGVDTQVHPPHLPAP